jgi:signal transduction histidine kinase
MNNLRGIGHWNCELGGYDAGMNSSRLEKLGSAAAGIAHDINNQLHLIVNHLAICDIDGAQRAAQRCSALTESMLAFCKGDPVAATAIDPGDFLLDFVDQLDLPESIDLRLNLAPQLPAIRADALSLNRALTNLISNACDALTGQGAIRITTSPQAIMVSDSGPGIPEHVMPRIFEPFFTTKGDHGTGLGLSIVRDLMHRQGGSVSVHSAPGQGAHFILHFRAG